jgi:hypothetical protein
MMAITEEALKEADDKSEENNSEDDDNDEESDFGGIPVEFLDLYNDEELKQTLIDLILTASDLDILDFQVNIESLWVFPLIHGVNFTKFLTQRASTYAGLTQKMHLGFSYKTVSKTFTFLPKNTNSNCKHRNAVKNTLPWW